MTTRTGWMGLMALVVGLSAVAPAWADVLRYHYVPAADGSNVVVLANPTGAPLGERLTGLGAPCGPARNPPRPTWMVTFRHPCTGRTVVVPLALPVGTPIIEHRGPTRLAYNYGSFSVQIQFFADGSLDVTYNNGFFRAL
jgi:hypothetical protein